ncbi:MAG: NADH-quinone oxidoreductase subunit H, partial [Actinomycetota bacterium]|nr:NADH-quinone oxidoreductase subunit H [Actinomycetota bacterium]
VSALATTMFLGGWHAPWPINMWDGANTGWWPLLWFTAKVWGFLFMYFWLRATLPRMRYDQFMAMGWKVLIPISLAWIMIVATARSLRNHGYDEMVTVLFSAGAIITLLIGIALWRTVRGKNTRKPAPQTLDPDIFPIPPLPTSEKPTATKERADA